MTKPFGMKPVKGILVGLGYTMLLATIIGMIWLFAFGAILGFDLTSPNLESEMAGSTLYMISDTIVSAIVLFLGGRAAGKRTHKFFSSTCMFTRLG